MRPLAYSTSAIGAMPSVFMDYPKAKPALFPNQGDRPRGNPPACHLYKSTTRSPQSRGPCSNPHTYVAFPAGAFPTYDESKSAITARSSFSSASVAAIFSRAKELNSRPLTILQLPRPSLRTGKEKISPSSTP